MILLIGGEKGGSGKSTIAQNLAVYFARKPLDVILVDADKQNTTSSWLQRRADNKAAARVFGGEVSGDIRNACQDYANRYDLVVIDCGGFDSQELRSGLVVADLCLYPFRPKRRDLMTVGRIVELINLSRSMNEQAKHFAVLSQCPSPSNQRARIDAALDACRELGLPALEHYTQMRNAYDDADESGFSTLEYSDSLAAAEIEALGLEVSGLFETTAKGALCHASQT